MTGSLGVTKNISTPEGTLSGSPGKSGQAVVAIPGDLISQSGEGRRQAVTAGEATDCQGL